MKELRRSAKERDNTKNHKSKNDEDVHNSNNSDQINNVGNPWVDFKNEKRSNKTYRSTTDREARLIPRQRVWHFFNIQCIF